MDGGRASGGRESVRARRVQVMDTKRAGERLLTVGEVARLTGLSVKALHHYEEKGLVPPAERTEAGYRLYGEEEVARLEFVKRAKLLGLTLEEVRELVSLAAGCNKGELVPTLTTSWRPS